MILKVGSILTPDSLTAVRRLYLTEQTWAFVSSDCLTSEYPGYLDSRLKTLHHPAASVSPINFLSYLIRREYLNKPVITNAKFESNSQLETYY